MAKKNSLGRGFDALIPKELDNSILLEDNNRVQNLLIEDIRPNPDQPRREFDPKALKELTSSIKRHGVLQPIIVVRTTGPKGYLIVAGERRYRAAKAANHKQIPAIIRSLKELEQMELSLIENIQRVDLSPMEQAISVYRLQQQFNLALEQIAEKLGKAPSTVSNLSRLLQLPDAAKNALNEGRISEGHARAILALKEREDLQLDLLRSIIDNELTVRQAEQFVIDTKKSLKSGGSRIDSSTAHKNAMLSEKLGHVLGTTVNILNKKTGGQIVIQYNTEDQLDSIVARLNKKK